ncbi:biotin/lipoyl-containing protein, partial [Vagococcus lutrae]
IEEISENERSEPKEAVQTQSQPQQSQEQTQASPAPTATSGGESVTAPMPGNIYKVQAKAGQAVKEGETVIVLEAMKMENEIVAPADGTISAINVTEGQAVEADDVLFEL